DYTGTLVFVSHDRYFLDRLPTRVLEIGKQTAAVYLGNYEDYLLKKQALADLAGGADTPARAEPAAVKSGNGTPGAAAARAKKKVNPYRIQQLSDKITELESTIQGHETRIAVLARMLASEELYRDYPLFRTTMEEH